MAKNPDKNEILKNVREKTDTFNTSELATTLQATIENLEEASRKASGEKAKEIKKKLAEAEKLKGKLVSIGKSLLEVKDTGSEREEVIKAKARKDIAKIVDKLGILLDTQEAVEGLKGEIEERRRLVYVLTNPANNKFLPANKRGLNFETLPIEELKTLASKFVDREKVLKRVKAGLKFLPFSEQAIDLAVMTVFQLKKIADKIELNKKTFEAFKLIEAFAGLAEKSLLVYFYKYLENESKPAIESLVKAFNEIRRKANKYKAAQRRVLEQNERIAKIQARIAKKQGGHFEMPPFDKALANLDEGVDSALENDLLEIFAKLLNDPASEIKKYLASFDAAIESQNASLFRLSINESAVVFQESLIDESDGLDELLLEYTAECKAVETFATHGQKVDDMKIKRLEGEIKAKQTSILTLNLGLLAKLIEGLKFDESLLGTTYKTMVSLASGPEQKQSLSADYESMKRGIQARIDAFLGQIADIKFALETMKDEEKFRAELASGKGLSAGSKAFAKKKAAFLGKKLEAMREEYDLTVAHDKEVGGDPEAIKRLAKLDAQKTAVSFEKDILEGKFNFKEALKAYRKLSADEGNPGLAGTVKSYLETYGLREIAENVFKPVDSGAIRFENDFAFQFNANVTWMISFGKSSEEDLEGKDGMPGARDKAQELLDRFTSNGYYLADLKKAQGSLKGYMTSLKNAGLEDSNIYRTLERANAAYGQLIMRFGAQKEHIKKFLGFVINDAEADTLWNSVKRFGTVYVPIIIGATLFAVSFAYVVGFIPGVSGTIWGLVATTMAAGAGATLGQEVMKEHVGIGMDLSAENLLKSFALNTALSLGFISGGRVLGTALRETAMVRPLGSVGRTLMKLANKASGAATPTGGRVTLGTVFARQLSSFGSTTARESVQEVFEEAGEQIHPLIGGLLSLVNSMDGMNIDTSNISTEAVALFSDAGVTLTAANDTRASFEYDSKSLSSLETSLSRLSGSVKKNSDGVLTFSFKPTISATNEAVFEFRPSQESFASRNFMSSDMGIALQVDFGMVTDSSGNYGYGGNLDALKGRLENSGFVCQVVEGVVIAQKGDLQLTFKPKSLVSGTNQSTMKNTRLESVEDLDPSRLGEIKAGTTIGSEVTSLLSADVATLWAKMKASLTGGIAPRSRPGALSELDAQLTTKVKTSLVNRGLPGDFLADISPAQQLEVLESVSAMETESDSAGMALADLEFVSQEQQFLDNAPDVEGDYSLTGKLLNPDNPDLFMSVLENDSDGLGAYRLAVLLNGQRVMPSFSYDQILEISKADQGLAEIVVEGMLRSNPEKFNELRLKFYEGLFAEFGGKERLEGLVNDVMENESNEALDELRAGMDSFTQGLKLSPRATALLVAAGIALTPGSAKADMFTDVFLKLPWYVEAFIVSWALGSLTAVGVGIAKLVSFLHGRTKAGIETGKKVADWRKDGVKARKRAEESLEAVTTLRHETNSLGDFVKNRKNNNRIRIEARIKDGVTYPASNPDLARPLRNFKILQNTLATSVRKGGDNDNFSFDRETLTVLDQLLPMLRDLSGTDDVDVAQGLIMDINDILTGNPGFLNRLKRPKNFKDIDTWEDTHETLNSARTYLTNDAFMDTSISNELTGRTLTRKEAGSDDLKLGLKTLVKLRNSLDGFMKSVLDKKAMTLPENIIDAGGDLASLLEILEDISRADSDNDIDLLATEIERLGDFANSEDGKSFLKALNNPERVELAEGKNRAKIVRNTAIITAIASALGIGTLLLWPSEEKQEPPAPQSSAEKAETSSQEATAQASVAATASREEVLKKNIPEKVEDPFLENVKRMLKSDAGKIPTPIRKIVEKFKSDENTNKELIEKLYIVDITNQLDLGGDSPMHEKTPEWLRQKPDLYLQARYLDYSSKLELLPLETPGLVSLKAIVSGRTDEMPTEFKELKTDAERVEYFQNLVDKTAGLLLK